MYDSAAETARLHRVERGEVARLEHPELRRVAAAHGRRQAGEVDGAHALGDGSAIGVARPLTEEGVALYRQGDGRALEVDRTAAVLTVDEPPLSLEAMRARRIHDVSG